MTVVGVIGIWGLIGPGSSTSRRSRSRPPPVCSAGSYSATGSSTSPIARDAVFANLSDGIVVVDDAGRVVDPEPAGSSTVPVRGDRLRRRRGVRAPRRSRISCRATGLSTGPGRVAPRSGPGRRSPGDRRRWVRSRFLTVAAHSIAGGGRGRGRIRVREPARIRVHLRGGRNRPPVSRCHRARDAPAPLPGAHREVTEHHRRLRNRRPAPVRT